MDFVGPYYKTIPIQFADKCSGYATCSSLKNGKKENAPESLQQQLDFYAKYGHHTKSYNMSVNILVSYSENVFTPEAMSKLCSEKGNSQRFSPPNVHQYNGLVENSIQQTKADATCSLVNAPHIPEQLWVQAWIQANRTRNQRKSLRPNLNLTREEEFKGI
jgi:hypothetical protein